MKFLFCKTCGRIYPVPEFGWFAELPPEEVEWSEDIDKQRRFCERFHCCEIFPVLNDFIVRGAEYDPLKVLGFLVGTSMGERIIIKTRGSIAESPRYEFYAKSQVFPLALLTA